MFLSPCQDISGGEFVGRSVDGQSAGQTVCHTNAFPTLSDFHLKSSRQLYLSKVPTALTISSHAWSEYVGRGLRQKAGVNQKVRPCISLGTFELALMGNAVHDLEKSHLMLPRFFRTMCCPSSGAAGGPQAALTKQRKLQSSFLAANMLFQVLPSPGANCIQTKVIIYLLHKIRCACIYPRGKLQDKFPGKHLRSLSTGV